MQIVLELRSLLMYAILIFVGCQYRTCVMLPLWHLEFWGKLLDFWEIDVLLLETELISISQ